MKKIFTLLACALVATSAFAQGIALDANRILSFYKVNDGTAFPKSYLAYFSLAKTDGEQNRKKTIPIATADFADVDAINDITLTTDFTDPETGFSVPAGHYTTLCNNANAGAISFYAGEGTSTHICNIKKLVVYLAGIPAETSTDGSYLSANEKYTRIGSEYIYTGSSSSSKYTNSVSGDVCTKSWLGRFIYSGLITSAESVPVLDADKKLASNTFTQDKLFRVVIDFKTPHSPDDGTGLDGSNIVSLNNNDCASEKALDKACYDSKTGKAVVDERVYNVCHKFVDSDGNPSGTNDNKPGYYGYDWTWSKDMGFSIQIKKAFNIFGIAFISGDDDAKTYAVDLNQFAGMASSEVRNYETVWTQIGGPTAIQAVNSDNAPVTPAKSIENGRVVISKNGHKYTAAGAMLK